MRRALILVISVASVALLAVVTMMIFNRDSDPAGSSRTGGSGQAPATPEQAPAGSGQGRATAPDGPLNGLNLTAYTRDGYSRPRADAAVRKIANLGATAITLTPTWYMDSGSSNAIRPHPAKTPDDAGVERAMRRIGESGLNVVLKPHVDVLDDTFRGDIEPADRGAWFRSYRQFIGHYAEIAAAQGADLFVVGTELKSTSSEPGPWHGLIRMVRSLFPGQLTYAANWDEYGQVPFWNDLDLIGIDAYFPLAEGNPDPTVTDLRNAWAPIVDELRSTSERWDKPVLLTEAGYPSQVGATAHPWEVKPGEPVDQALQARAYRAALRAFTGEPWMAGINWWSWRADPSPDEDQSIDYTPEGKRAENLLRREWSSAAG